MSEKLQKVLARAGQGSRRELEKAISEGKVSVNGEIASLGARVETSDAIRYNGILVNLEESDKQICRVIAYHKQEGELSTRKDPEGRDTIFDRLPKIRNSRWIAIGRLDTNTSGLMLFTTDGELANRLTRSKMEIEREYAVRTFGEVVDKNIQHLRSGVELKEDGKVNFTKVKLQPGEGLNRWYHVIMTQGRDRAVRQMWEHEEIQISRLIRLRYGNIALDKSLPRGGWQDLELAQINYLRGLVGLADETESFLNLREEHRNKTARIRRAVRKHAAFKKADEQRAGKPAKNKKHRQKQKPRTRS
ncbi:23S rRNA pseudouridine(2605) synthase RluB [Psychrobium sp. 1_MG-2023]|uniref:23S rRNA pseudouridine(2605) synthase RluB n=1 Tax=Psychrobium sp. 1_MG-2023 TaxID=3062624 RepID=UPI000C34EA4B|nr:23S rRNA pseudouridine(2605) synthase RluB [Psychrobium sp. 1_MG-2023]MDP2560241.1 23S rRNA pseudouridine(2605) synthase RluB [Psychrobium sp. 1_MG-2023]PKF57051.1 23S rRNA pseudouridine(2605) synthase RluB [Alteromonadales bacterium alter-6D02]